MRERARHVKAECEQQDVAQCDMQRSQWHVAPGISAGVLGRPCYVLRVSSSQHWAAAGRCPEWRMLQLSGPGARRSADVAPRRAASDAPAGFVNSRVCTLCKAGPLPLLRRPLALLAAHGQLVGQGRRAIAVLMLGPCGSCEYVRARVCACLCLFSVCLCLCLGVCVRTCVRMCVRAYVCTYVCKYTCTYIHVHACEAAQGTVSVGEHGTFRGYLRASGYRMLEDGEGRAQTHVRVCTLGCRHL